MRLSTCRSLKEERRFILKIKAELWWNAFFCSNFLSFVSRLILLSLDTFKVLWFEIQNSYLELLLMSTAATTSLMQCAPPVIVHNTWKQTLKHFKPTICTDTSEGTTKYEYCFHNLFWMLHKLYPISKKNHGRWKRVPTCPSSNVFGTSNKCSGNFQGWLNKHVGNVASLVSSVAI